MGKRIVNLYVDDESIQSARAKGVNMSALFREILTAELEGKRKNDKDAEIKRLKLLNAQLESRIKELEKKIKDSGNKEKIIPWR